MAAKGRRKGKRRNAQKARSAMRYSIIPDCASRFNPRRALGEVIPDGNGVLLPLRHGVNAQGFAIRHERGGNRVAFAVIEQRGFRAVRRDGDEPILRRDERAAVAIGDVYALV